MVKLYSFIFTLSSFKNTERENHSQTNLRKSAGNNFQKSTMFLAIVPSIQQDVGACHKHFVKKQETTF